MFSRFSLDRWPDLASVRKASPFNYALCSNPNIVGCVFSASELATYVFRKLVFTSITTKILPLPRALLEFLLRKASVPTGVGLEGED